MRVLTWNVNKATDWSDQPQWKTFLELDPDVAVLQEVYGVPECVRDHYDVDAVKARSPSGEAKYSTAVLARKSDWTMGPEVTWKSEHDWVNRIQDRLPGWLVGRQVGNESGERLNVVSVHSPTGSVEYDLGKNPALRKEILDGVDVAPVRLKNKTSGVWFTEILWSLLKGAAITDDDNWIVAGDFNSSVLFDKPDDRANEEVIDRLNALGLFDCVFQRHGEHVPTFWSFPEAGKGRPPAHQLDYFYVNAPVLARLTGVAMGVNLPESRKERDKFGGSDHMPVVCDFR